jgi:hypothetical protein
MLVYQRVYVPGFWPFVGVNVGKFSIHEAFGTVRLESHWEKFSKVGNCPPVGAEDAYPLVEQHSYGKSPVSPV